MELFYAFRVSSLNNIFEQESVFQIALENDMITSSKSLIRFCHQSYIKEVESVLCIVNEVMNNNSWNIILKALEINRQLNELFGKQVFCYVTKCTYVAQKSED
jgi:hypothetical protein